MTDYNEMFARREAARQREFEQMRRDNSSEYDEVVEPVYYISYAGWESAQVDTMVKEPYYNIDDCIEAYRRLIATGFDVQSVYRVNNNVIEWLDIDACIASHGDE